MTNEISQRELRNNNAEVVRGVERGDSYTVTRHGVAVARIVPLSHDTDLRCDRPASRQDTFTTWPRVTAQTSVSSVLEDLRSER